MSRRVRLSVIIVVLVFLTSALVYYGYWAFHLRGLPSSVRAQTGAVLRAYQMSRITGGYWQDELQDQLPRVQSLPLDARLAFYKAILLSCDLDTSRGTVFVDSVGSDAEAFHAYLVTFTNGVEFLHLRAEVKDKVVGWIDVMADVTEQQSEERALSK